MIRGALYIVDSLNRISYSELVVLLGFEKSIAECAGKYRSISLP
jgi:hypothetical protein